MLSSPVYVAALLIMLIEGTCCYLKYRYRNKIKLSKMQQEQPKYHGRLFFDLPLNDYRCHYIQVPFRAYQFESPEERTVPALAEHNMHDFIFILN